MKPFHLNVQEPCHEDWGKMSETAGGRFCSSCTKEVVDFTGMSDAQLIQFFKQPAGSVCGRFQAGQLDRNLVLAAAPKRLPWLRYFFSVLIPAYLLSNEARGQCRVPVKGETLVVQDSLPVLKPIHNIVGKVAPLNDLPGVHVYRLSGTVVDISTGLPVSWATLHISGTKDTITVNEKGYFNFQKNSRAKRLWITVQAEDYRTLVLPYEDLPRNPKTGAVLIRLMALDAARVNCVIPDMPEGSIVMGAIISEPPVRDETDAVPVVQKLKDTVQQIRDKFQHFFFPESRVKGVVFPNPVPAGQDAQVEFEVKGAGKFEWQVFDMNGRLMSSRHLDLPAGRQRQTLSASDLGAAPGARIFCLLDERRRKIYEAKLVVQ